MIIDELKKTLKRVLFLIFRTYETLPVKPMAGIVSKIIKVIYGSREKNKQMIFGIGLSRTGTTSLNAALNELGYKSKHFFFFPVTTNIPYVYFILKEYNAATDLPAAANFKKLDRLYPDSKFILTVRDIDSWLKSCKKFFTYQMKIIERPKWWQELHLKMYNSISFNYEKFKRAYYRHLNDVSKYFENRKEDLLVLNVVKGEGYQKLCKFLGEDVINKPFPHKNISNNQKSELLK